ncbi:MAG: hypothetical protein JWO01_206, partial [Microbacteriaceae bacterium]|nr:hypothetical protein [Microbacteriaceae bacterium]
MTIHDGDSEAKLQQEATALLSLLGAKPTGTLNDDQLLSRMETAEHLGRLVDTLRITAAAEVADRSRHELGS